MDEHSVIMIDKTPNNETVVPITIIPVKSRFIVTGLNGERG